MKWNEDLGTLGGSFSQITGLALPIQLPEQHTPYVQHTRYELINIGTFGGPASYINPANDFGSPNLFNLSGYAGRRPTKVASPRSEETDSCGRAMNASPIFQHSE